jgi:hypothetical protein
MRVISFKWLLAQRPALLRTPGDNDKQVGREIPEELVRGVYIIYEIVGDHGPFVARTPGSGRQAVGESLKRNAAAAALRRASPASSENVASFSWRE